MRAYVSQHGGRTREFPWFLFDNVHWVWLITVQNTVSAKHCAHRGVLLCDTNRLICFILLKDDVHLLSPSRSIYSIGEIFKFLSLHRNNDNCEILWNVSPQGSLILTLYPAVKLLTSWTWCEFEAIIGRIYCCLAKKVFTKIGLRDFPLVMFESQSQTVKWISIQDDFGDRDLVGFRSCFP